MKTTQKGKTIMKKMIALFLCLCLTVGLVPALAENAQFTVRTYPLWDDYSQIGTMDLRFYADKPNIAYIGIKTYMAEVQKLDLSVTAQEEKSRSPSRSRYPKSRSTPYCSVRVQRVRRGAESRGRKSTLRRGK